MMLSVCLPIVFPQLALDEALRRAGQNGYRYAECWRVKEEEVLPLSQAIRESGVKVVSIVADDFSLNVPADRERWLNNLQGCATRAKALGASFIVTQVGQDNGEPREEQFADDKHRKPHVQRGNSPLLPHGKHLHFSPSDTPCD